MIIVRAFEKWRSKLKNFIYLIDVIIDHKNLKYFMSIKQLNRRRTRWNEFVFKFNYHITYRWSKVDDKLDALTRRLNDFFKKKNIDDSRHRYQHQTILKFHVLNKKIKKELTLKFHLVDFHCRIIVFDLIQLHFCFVSFMFFIILTLMNMKFTKSNVDDAKSQLNQKKLILKKIQSILSRKRCENKSRIMINSHLKFSKHFEMKRDIITKSLSRNARNETTRCIFETKSTYSTLIVFVFKLFNSLTTIWLKSIQVKSNAMNFSIVSIDDSIFINTFNASYEIVTFALASSFLVNELKNNYVFYSFQSVDDVIYSWIM